MSNLYEFLDGLGFMSHYGPWFKVASIIGIVFTMSWVIGLNKRVRRGTALVLGPPSLIAFITAIPLAVLMWGTDGFSKATIQFLEATSEANVIWRVITLMLLIALIALAFKIGFRVGHWFSKSTFRVAIKRGYLFELAGAAGVGLILNSALINNQSTYCIPMILSAILGLYTLIGVRPKWTQLKRELAKGYAVEFGILPKGRKAETAEDRQILKEAYAEVEKFLNDPEEKWITLEKKIKVRMRIAEQLGMKLELETEEQTRARIKATQQAEAEAEADQAEIEAEGVGETHISL